MRTIGWTKLLEGRVCNIDELDASLIPRKDPRGCPMLPHDKSKSSQGLSPDRPPVEGLPLSQVRDPAIAMAVGYLD